LQAVVAAAGGAVTPAAAAAAVTATSAGATRAADEQKPGIRCWIREGITISLSSCYGGLKYH
jgi:hypothetical protein